MTRDWENHHLLHLNRLSPRVDFVPYPDDASALTFEKGRLPLLRPPRRRLEVPLVAVAGGGAGRLRARGLRRRRVGRYPRAAVVADARLRPPALHQRQVPVPRRPAACPPRTPPAATAATSRFPPRGRGATSSSASTASIPHFYVWVNGAGGRLQQGQPHPAEFDITEHVRRGKNVLAVRVFKWSDGSYLEDQDMWWLSGIFRNVYLVAMGPLSVWDVAVRTDLDAEYRDGQLYVKTTISNRVQTRRRRRPRNAPPRRRRQGGREGEKCVLQGRGQVIPQSRRPRTSPPPRSGPPRRRTSTRFS